MQRVNEASLFEVTELQEVVRTSKGFIMLRLARVVRQYPAQCFGKIPGLNLSKLSRLSGVFPPFVDHFFKRAREPEVKYVTFFTKFDWPVISSSRSKYGTFENE